MRIPHALLPLLALLHATPSVAAYLNCYADFNSERGYHETVFTLAPEAERAVYAIRTSEEDSAPAYSEKKSWEGAIERSIPAEGYGTRFDMRVHDLEATVICELTDRCLGEIQYLDESRRVRHAPVQCRVDAAPVYLHEKQTEL